VTDVEIPAFVNNEAGTANDACAALAKDRTFRVERIAPNEIAARVREGLARGKRIFISQTDPDSPSGHNLHDLGFRTLYRARWYLRPLE